MSIFESIFLGFIQGATEFIPISSSGHLILGRYFLGIDLVGTIAFDAILQLATILAVFVYFYKDVLNLFKTVWNFILRKENKKEDIILLQAIVLGTIPALFFGLILENTMDTFFRNIYVVVGGLFLGTLIMYFADKYTKSDKILNGKRGFFVGFFQALALVPGVSRSGATISGGLFLGLNRELATRFSFLLALPIITGSGLKKLLELLNNGGSFLNTELLLGAITAFVVGLLAIHFLISFLKKNSLKVFIYYRIALIFVILIFTFL